MAYPDHHDREMAKWAHQRLDDARRRAEDEQRRAAWELDDSACNAPDNWQRGCTLDAMARKQGSIEFENNPQITHVKHEDAALAAIKQQHPEYTNVVLTGEGGQMGGTQRRAEFTYDTAGED